MCRRAKENSLKAKVSVKNTHTTTTLKKEDHLLESEQEELLRIITMYDDEDVNSYTDGSPAG